MRPAQLALLQKARALPERKVSAIAFTGESYVLQTLSILIVLCVAAYLYFVSVSIMNVITNREASVESERLRSIVGSLEEQYFQLSKAVSPESASAHGLTASASTSFVRRTSAVASNVTPSEI